MELKNFFVSYGVFMKKYVITLLLTLSCGAFTLAAASCGDTENSSTQNGETHVVTLQGGEGYGFLGDDVSPSENGQWTATVQKGDALEFSLDLGAFYEGTPTVTVGNTVLAEKDGVYSFTVESDVTVNVSGVVKATSNMLGTGDFSDAFVITKPIDLLYIAEKVNAGDTAYTRAAYVLGADIDCKGEELEIIGDLSTPQSFFSGCFSCVTDSESGAMERYTISNFVITSDDSNYVGLFGCVQTDISVTGSGMFYGIRLDDFEINVSSSKLPKGNRTLYVGSMIGYGVGVTSYLCDATNGEINVTGDALENAIAGGLMGVQQGYYFEDYAQAYLAETAYATVDVDVRSVQGVTLFAGGIAGYLYTNSLFAPAVIHNSYATGNVSGAVRAGGVSGGLGQYTSVASSYSSGNVMANASSTKDTDGLPEEFSYAYAGGIAGYAENDTIVNDCFAAGVLSATAVDGKNSQATNEAIAGGDEAGTVSVSSQQYVVKNCRGKIEQNLLETLTKELGWQTYNWIISDSSLPTINYDASSESVTTTVTVHYVTKTADGVKAIKVGGAENDKFSYTDAYAPIMDAFNNGDINAYLTADDGVLLSYGYFFDEACTKPVPYSYLTTRSVDLYVGFTDPAPIVGEYYVQTENANEPIKLLIQADGTALCNDGANEITVNYQYDGEVLLLEGVRFAKFFTGAVDTETSVNEDTAFDLNRYILYHFQAVLTEQDVLELYDGTYFTAKKPLTAYKANNRLQGVYYLDDTALTRLTFRPDGTGVYEATGAYEEFTYTCNATTVSVTLSDETVKEYARTALLSLDALNGVWQKSASVNKFYSFDGRSKNGAGIWKSYYRVYVRNGGNVTSSDETIAQGTYEWDDVEKVFVLKNGTQTYGTAKLDSDGYLVVAVGENKETFSQNNGFKGIWESENKDVVLNLNGVNGTGLGVGVLTYTYKAETVSYDLAYQVSQTAGYIVLYYLDTPLGYFTVDTWSNIMVATVFDAFDANADSDYLNTYLYLVGDYAGEWISDTAIFDDIRFSGIGTFNADGNWESTLTIGTETVRYTLEKSTLSGWFDYDGTRYTIAYDDVTGKITVNENILLQRKDIFADIDFVSVTQNGEVTHYAFDGKGELVNGGSFTVNGETEYGYKQNGDAFDVFAGNEKIGSIVRSEKQACYVLTIGTTQTQLFVHNEFMGNWAISGAFETLKIGPTDLDGNITASYKGQNVKISYYNSATLTFSYFETNGMPVTNYMFLIYDENNVFDCFAISEYNSTIYNDYRFCSIADEMMGEWTQAQNPDFSISFDGSQTNYNNGTANLAYKGFATAYYYRTYDDGSVLLWSQETYDGSTLYYTIEWCQKTDAGAYVNANGKAFKRLEADSLFKMQAKDENGYVYTFDGRNTSNDVWGTVTAEKDGETTVTYSYDIVAFNTDRTATLTLKDETGKEYTATLNYRDSENITIKLEEK